MRHVPPPPKPTPEQKGGFPRPIQFVKAAFWIFVWWSILWVAIKIARQLGIMQ